jgi:uncharacterized protein YjbJ (UPF0337 family)
MFNKSEGTIRNIAGHVQEAFGSITGDTRAQVEGKARRAAGNAQYGYGEIVEQLRESAVKNPIGTVAIVAGVFFVVGAIWSRR